MCPTTEYVELVVRFLQISNAAWETPLGTHDAEVREIVRRSHDLFVAMTPEQRRYTTARALEATSNP